MANGNGEKSGLRNLMSQQAPGSLTVSIQGVTLAGLIVGGWQLFSALNTQLTQISQTSDRVETLAQGQKQLVTEVKAIAETQKDTSRLDHLRERLDVLEECVRTKRRKCRL